MRTLFRYRAATTTGAIRLGQFIADSVEEIDVHLARQRLLLIHARPALHRLFLFNGVRRDELAPMQLQIFCLYMQQMCSAGIPVLDAVREITLCGDASLQVWASRLVMDIEAGHTLSDSLVRQARTVDTVLVNMIRAGEAGGRLSEVFAQIHELLVWQADHATKLRKALFYPAILAAFVLCVCMVMLVCLLPQLNVMLQDQGAQVPAVLRAMLSIGDVLAVTAVPGAVFLGASLLGLKTVPPFRRYLVTILEKLSGLVPWIGPTLTRLATARCLRLLALMYTSGIPLLEGVRLTKEAAGHGIVARRLESWHRQLVCGQPLADAVARSELLPPMMQALMRMGELSGRLDQALLAIADIEYRKTTALLDRVQSVLEPALTLTLGLVLAGTLACVFLPIYDVVASVQP